MTLSPEARQRAIKGAIGMAGAVAVLLLVAAQYRTAPLSLASAAPYAFLLAAAALGAGLGAAERGPASWRRPRTMGLLAAAGGLGGALSAAARQAAFRLTDLTDTGIPAVLRHGGPLIAPLAAARLVPAPGALSVGIMIGQAAAWLFGAPTTSYPALALAQLPLVVVAAELWLATIGRSRTVRDMVVAGALVGIGSSLAAFLLLPDTGTAIEWLGRLIRDVLAGTITGWFIGAVKLPFPPSMPGTPRDDDEDLYAHG